MVRRTPPAHHASSHHRPRSGDALWTSGRSWATSELAQALSAVDEDPEDESEDDEPLSFEDVLDESLESLEPSELAAGALDAPPDFEP